MKNIIMSPFEIFQREKKINEEMCEVLSESNEGTSGKENLIYFFILANFMLLFMNLFIYFSIVVVLVTTPFYPLSSLFRLVLPLIFLPFLGWFQTRWIPKVRKVHMKTIGFDVDSIVERHQDVDGV